tara:strand:- start:739 stop:1341 length:603 start_codon:yes stop_codon:yes gene_type:complete
LERLIVVTLKLIVKLVLAVVLFIGIIVAARTTGTEISVIWNGEDSIYTYLFLILSIALTVVLLVLAKKLTFKNTFHTPDTSLFKRKHAAKEKGKSMGIFNKKRELIKSLSEEDIQTYFGDDSIKYFKIKAKLDEGKTLYWSWWAFIFGGAWAGYNKWGYGVFVSIVVWLLNGWAGALILSVVLGLFAITHTVLHLISIHL